MDLACFRGPWKICQLALSLSDTEGVSGAFQNAKPHGSADINAVRGSPQKNNTIALKRPVARGGEVGGGNKLEKKKGHLKKGGGREEGANAYPNKAMNYQKGGKMR